MQTFIGMWYDEQLILTGALDDVGTPIRTNWTELQA